MFDRLDILEAWYLWLSHNHGGQFSPEYKRLSKMSEYFSPRDSLKLETLTKNGKDIYNSIGC